MLFRDLRASHPAPLETAGIDQAAGRVARRILEGAPQAPLLDRLGLAPGRLYLLASLADARAIILAGLERGGADNPSTLLRFQDRVPVGEAAVRGGQGLRAAMRVDDVGADESVFHLASEGARVADHGSADSAGHAGAELEAGPPCLCRVGRQLRHQVEIGR